LDSLLGGGSGDGTSLSINNLATNSLFGGQKLDLLSQDNAQSAVNAIGNAINQVTNTLSNIGAFQQTLDFAAANVDSALVNQEAARSQLTDTDIAAAST